MKKSMCKRPLAMLLSLSMVLGMLTGMPFGVQKAAAEGEPSDTRDITVNVPDFVTGISFYLTDGADDDGCDRPGDRLNATADAPSDGYTTYTVTAPADADRVSYRAHDALGRLGGMAFPASLDEVTLREFHGYITNTKDGNYLTPVDAVFTVSDTIYLAKAGDAGTDENGLYCRYLLHAAGNYRLYTYSALPIGGAASDYSAIYAENQTVSPGNSAAARSLEMPPAGIITITVPEGAAARLFRQTNNYNVSEYQPVSITADAKNSTVIYSFSAVVDSNTTYRVSMPGKITKAGYLDSNALSITYGIADAQPHDRPVHNPSTKLGSRAEDSILLNINGQNSLNLSQGESYRLRAYRAAWQIVNGDTDNIMIEPDFRYTLLNGHGVVSVSEVADNKTNGAGNWLDITAESSGVAILEVTYDAIDIGGKTSYTGVYGACDPDRTGLVVINVDGAAAVDFGIKGLSKCQNSPAAWDAEYDTLYFLGDSGTLPLSPTGTGITDVAVSNDKGNTWTSLTADGGIYTTTIVPGNNILRVTTDSGEAYQVVRGCKLTMSTANQTAPGSQLKAGDEARISFTGLKFPIPKMGGIYNPGYAMGAHRLTYTADSGGVSGNALQYNFITQAYVDVTIPESGKITLTDGHVSFGVMGTQDIIGTGSGGINHRSIPESGVPSNFGAAMTTHARSILPDIVIDLHAASVSVASSADGAVKPGSDVLLTATATAAASYQWYETTANSIAGGSEIQGAVNGVFRPGTGDVGAKYYYCVINGGLASNIVAVEVCQTYALTVVNGSDLTAQGPYLAGESVNIAADGAPSGMVFAGWICRDNNYASFTNRMSAHTAFVMPAGNVTIEATYKAASPESSGSLKPGEIAGYVTMSFDDHGARVSGEKVDYPSALGTIIPAAQVPFQQGDTIADVTLRLLKSLGFSYTHTGSTKSGFYLTNISGTVGDSTIMNFGEFSSGAASGWMITWNNWFINMGASEFSVEDGDIIRWQNTCSLGKDLNCDMDNPSAKITGINFAKSYGRLAPSFGSSQTGEYIYTIPASVKSVSLEGTQENYWAKLTYTSGGRTYKPLANIQVSNGTVIKLECAYIAAAGEQPRDRDTVSLTIQVEGETEVKTESGLTIKDIETPLSGETAYTMTVNTTVKNKIASSVIGKGQMDDAIKAAEELGAVIIDIAAESTSLAVTKHDITLPKESLDKMADKRLYLGVQTVLASVSFGSDNLRELCAAATGNTLTMSVAQLEEASLSDGERERAEGRPVYELEFSSDGKKITVALKGTLSISIPYTLKRGELSAGISVRRLLDDGTTAEISCVYDSAKKTVKFEAPQAGRYIIAYDKDALWNNPFIDVAEGDWFFESARFVSESALMNGTGDNLFSPNILMSRAMLVTTLYRFAGNPDTASEHEYADVRDGQWYSEAVKWGRAEGIVEGLGDGRFGVNDNITREQLAVLLYRYAKKLGLDVSAASYLGVYSDSGDISSWALDAMRWANHKGIITGRTAVELAPLSTATRAEVATVLMRFADKLA